MSSSTKQPPCDQCYERRVRCRSSPGESCSACLHSGLHCTRERVRGKRGPKKSAVTPKSSRRVVKRPSTLSISPSAHEPENPHHGAPQTLQYHGRTPANQNIVSTDWNGQTEHSLRRAQIQATHSPSHFMTVNELADFVLHDTGLNDTRRNSHWLLGVRNVHADHEGTTSNGVPGPSSTTARSAVSLIGANANHQDISSLHNHNHRASSTPSLLSAPQIVSESFDCTALALAAGLPIRLGKEMSRCVDIHFSQSHHIIQILHEESFRKLLEFPSQLTASHRALFLAFCAVTKLRSLHMVGPVEDRESRELGCVFLEQCLRIRSDIDANEDPSPHAVITAYLLHVAYACLRKDKTARYYSRMAVCVAMDLGLHKKGQPTNLPDFETVCAQRTLALLYVIERATSVLDRFDVLLFREPPCLPDLSFDEKDRRVLKGFKCLFDLFGLLENQIVELWCSEKSIPKQNMDEIRDCISSTQIYLSTTLFEDEGLSDFCRADVQVTQQWLRLIFWQMAMRLGFLSNWSEEPSFSYKYPIQIGKDLCFVLQSLPEAAIRAHHFSIYNKIFEIAYSFMDVFMISGVSDSSEIRELKQLFHCLAASPITHMTYARVLMERLEPQESHTDVMNDFHNVL